MAGLREIFLYRRSRSNYLMIIFSMYYLLMLTFGGIATKENAGVNQLLVWGFTPFLIFFFLEYAARTHASFSSESIRLLVFLFFVLQSRLYAIDFDLFDTAFRKVLLNVLLFVIVEQFIAATGEIKIFFIVTLIGTTFLCIYMLRAPSVEVSLIDYEGFKIENKLMNTNGLANYAIEGLLAFLFLWHNLKPRSVKYLTLLSIPVFVITIIGAASKAGLLGVFVSVSLWVLLCLSISMKNKLTMIFTIFLFAVGLLLADEYIVNHTYLGERFHEVGNVDEYYENDSRGKLFAIAMNLFFENPFLGVGLMQVAANNDRGAYSHNEYSEILANFGLIGAFIYFPFLIIIWKRLVKNLRMISSGNIDTKYNLNFMRVMFVVLLVRGISVPLFTAFDEMILFGVIGGYSLYCKKERANVYSFHHRLAAQ